MAESLPLEGSINAGEAKGNSTEQGSEAEFDIFCDPCRDLENQTQPATGYCCECKEHLCTVCIASHRRVKLSRNHNIQNEETMPRTKPAISAEDFNKCSNHLDQFITFYCKSHQQLCCSSCIASTHKVCEIATITNMAQHGNSSNELGLLKTKLVSLKTVNESNLKKCQQQSCINESQHATLIVSINKLRAEFERVQKQTELDAEKLRDNNIDTLTPLNDKYISVKEDLEKITSIFDKLNTYDSQEHNFIAMKQAESWLSAMEDKTTEQNFDIRDHSLREYIFRPCQKLQAILKQIPALGTFTDKHAAQKQYLKSPNFLYEIKVSPEDPKSCCFICSLTLLNDNYLVALELNNKKAKLINTKEKRVKSTIDVPINGFFATKITEDKIIVPTSAYYQASNLQFISIYGERLVKDKCIGISGSCSSVAYNHENETLLITFNCHLEIIDMCGKVLQKIQRPSGDIMMSAAFTLDKTGIYITHNARSVTLISLEGKVQELFTDDSLKQSCYVYVHASGIVYVTDLASPNVFALDPKRSDHNRMSKWKLAEQTAPGLAYCEKRDILYISSMDDSVKVFEMKLAAFAVNRH